MVQFLKLSINNSVRRKNILTQTIRYVIIIKTNNHKGNQLTAEDVGSLCFFRVKFYD